MSSDADKAAVVVDRFPPNTRDVHSQIVIVHQLRASAKIQSDAKTAQLGMQATTDRAELMRQAADTIEARAALRPAEAGGEVPKTCDGKEQDAFEEWAKGEKFVMDTHPIHWLFLNEQTNAARKGWRAALEYVQRVTTPAQSIGETVEETGYENWAKTASTQDIITEAINCCMDRDEGEPDYEDFASRRGAAVQRATLHLTIRAGADR